MRSVIIAFILLVSLTASAQPAPTGNYGVIEHYGPGSSPSFTNLTITGGACLGFAVCTYAADELQIGDSAMKLQYSSSVPLLQFDTNDFYRYSRSANQHALFIANTSEFVVGASGAMVDNGIYIGSNTGTPEDNDIIAEGSGEFAEGLQVGFNGTPTQSRIDIGDANYRIHYNSGNPLIVFNSNDYFLFTRATPNLELILSSTTEFTFKTSGLAVANGIYVGSAGATPTDNDVTLEGDVTFDERVSISSVSRTFSYTDMTDGGGTSGTITITQTIPDGAIVQRAICHTLTGFAGNVSATIQIGDGSTVDRYSTGTPSVFTTNASGVDLGAPSGTVWHDAGATVTITITSATDFSLVTAGTITCGVYYWGP